MNKFGVEKIKSLFELKKMLKSVDWDKEVFAEKWGADKVEAYDELKSLWDSIEDTDEEVMEYRPPK
tara:strand:+ start:282 stop:479 length:198 start_codon:yes stop_codon:yes gene_type:complete